ncbi:polysaccharide biosynthesis protein [Citrobacter amalonaticus]|uniref:lipopolysaccharide biosynthesis protein n=1 Tax=Citrobacter amalonaticus TaxID=35703 RepID=UPI0020BE1FF1|nr:polysaccharide biosynthesis protein [Citrobacter amalonaticus]MCK8152302.1 polysaccharide biosynthesis protein [Citrobacter amalonaticus]
MFKKSLAYLILNYFIQFINIALNLVFMKYLSPFQMGSLALARTWQQLVDYAHLGTRYSLDRYIPVTHDEERLRLVASVLIFTAFSASVVFIVALISSANDVTVTSLTFCGVGISLGNIIKCYYRASNRINEMLKLVVKCQLIPVLIPLLLYLIVHSWNMYIYSSVICYLFTITSLLYHERTILKVLSFNRFFFTLKSIISSSLWLFINAIFIFLYLVMDRFFINHTLGRDALGEYSIITFAFTALMIIPSTCAELLFVKVIKESCTAGKILFIKEVMIIFCVTIVGVVAANILMGYFIHNYTNYGTLVSRMHIATLAVIPFTFTSIYYHVMNGLDFRKQLVMVNGSLCLGLAIYYILPVIMPYQVSIDYYLYAKLTTGWLIIVGYIICIGYYQLFKRKAFEDVKS